MEKFLKVNKNHFNSKLKPLEILILSQIEEFINNGHECYLTNKQFAEMFCVTEPTVDAALNKLEQLKYITRKTEVVSGHGKTNKMRKLLLVKPTKEEFQFSF
jgi:DNA-binding MarR family transcriptional regulator